jgi:hypothetical protein
MTDRIIVRPNEDDLQIRFSFSDILSMRGIDCGHECTECMGMGVKVYGSTATWHGGIGGQAMTSGICDKCWGSGDRNRPWLNLRSRPS